MQLFYLYYFKTAAETENLKLASQMLNITQPALSKAITNLENELGVSLFERSKRRLRLSKTGAEYYRYIAAAFESIEAGSRYIESVKQDNGNRIVIGSTVSELLPPLIRAYRARYPDSYLEITQYLLSPDELREQLRRGSVDFALSSVPMTTDEVEQLRLMDEEVLLLVAQTHPFAQKLTVALADCIQEPFLVNDVSFDRQVVIDCCKLVGFTPQITLCSNETDTVGAALEAGQGVSLVPSNVYYQKHDPNGAVALRLSDVEVIRMLTIAYRRDHIFTGTALEFFQFTKAFYTELDQTLQAFLADCFPGQVMEERKTLGLNDLSILDKIK